MTDGLNTESNQYLTFMLGDEEFALQIAKVREVLDYTSITKVPRMPDFLCGVINLRGYVVPVVDLRLKLGIPAVRKLSETCIVIVEVNLENELILMGALTDSVQEVIDIDSSQISPPPHIGFKINTDFIKGMGKCNDGFVIILDIDRVLSEQEMALLSSTSEGQDNLLLTGAQN